jgi:hypothetical protein
MDIFNLNLPTATTQSGHYEYFQNQDGSGQIRFDWKGLSDSDVQVSARMQAEWIGSGAGRADLTADLTPNLPDQSTTLGTDCWGVDTVATYSFRLRDEATGQKRDEGSIASCLFLF